MHPLCLSRLYIYEKFLYLTLNSSASLFLTLNSMTFKNWHRTYEFLRSRGFSLFPIFSFSFLISYCLFHILKDKFSSGPYPFSAPMNSRRPDLVLHSPSLSRQEQAPGTTAVARGWWPKPGQLIWGWHWHEPQPWSPSRFLPGNTTTLTLTTVVQVLDNIHL